MNGPLTPDTSSYLLLGLTTIAVIVGTYTLTLIYRLRRLNAALTKVSGEK
ncbi:MAG: hypothetical protein KF726_25455 [Anaerolineae bacterium]|nr:hypothetical protein [Anaerolineae bacterium]